MSRKKRAPLKPWLSATADCYDGRFIQVGRSLLQSAEFQMLSAGARMLYLCLCVESGGKRDFQFPLSVAKKYGIANVSLRRQIDELTERGFITVTSGANARAPNLYSFSHEWRAGIKD